MYMDIFPRSGKLTPENQIVFSKDAYHSQFIDSFSWSNLIQLNHLSQNVCVFLGVTLTDPNLRRLLDVSMRKLRIVEQIIIYLGENMIGLRFMQIYQQLRYKRKTSGVLRTLRIL